MAAAKPQAGPFASVPFRFLFTAYGLNNLVFWLHTVAAALLMTSMSATPLMTALVQSAISLPVCVFGAYAGVLCDRSDRRRLMLATQVGGVITTASVLAVSLGGAMSPWVLLALTFALGSTYALASTAWVTAVPDMAPASYRVNAIGLVAVGFNSARAVGPALAAGLIAVGSVDTVLAAILMSALAVLVIVWRACPPLPAQAPTGESVWDALRSGIRYAWQTPVVRRGMGRNIAFVIAGSAIWALLPLLARNFPGHTPSSAYAWMLGSMGVGAIGGGFLLARTRQALGATRLMNCCAVVFAAMIALAATIGTLWVAVPALFVAGSAWVTSNTSVMASLQTAVPGWVRSRIVSLNMLAFQFSLGTGSMLWGTVANGIGVPATLVASAAACCLSLVLVGRWSLDPDPAREAAPAAAQP